VPWVGSHRVGALHNHLGRLFGARHRDVRHSPTQEGFLCVARDFSPAIARAGGGKVVACGVAQRHIDRELGPGTTANAVTAEA